MHSIPRIDPLILRRSRRGQALVETAVMSMFLVVLLMGAFEFGRAIYSYLTVIQATRDGARVAIISSNSDAVIKETVRQTARPLTILLSNIQVTPNDSDTNRVEVNVTATYRFTTLFPLVSEFWGGGELLLQSTMVSRVDRP